MSRRPAFSYMIRKRRRYFATHPEADLNETMEKMKRGLLAYGQGKTDVETALKKEGLSAPRAGTHTMYVMSYIGQQAALLEEQGNQTKYSFQGIAEETGRKIYRADFGEGLEKREKQKKLVQLIQDVWAKKPITLTLNDEGTERKITAKFDPDYDEAGKRPTDAGKMAYGNKMGSSKERRITLELSGDMHQIISDAAYLTSEKERGKQTPTHQDVKKWDYFATDIIVEKAAEGKAPYTVFVDVKEKEKGNYVYTFYALNEKKSAKLRSLATAAPSIIQGVTTTKPVEAADGAMDFTGTSVKENSIVDTSIFEGSENVNGNYNKSSEADYNKTSEAEEAGTQDALKFSVAEEQDGQTQLPDVTEDAELSAQAAGDEDMRAALMLVQRLYDTARNGEGYLELNGRGAIQAGDWQKRVEGIRDRLLSETGSGYGKGALTRRLNAILC